VDEPVLEARGLLKSYGAPVLQDVSLSLRKGEVHAVVGENGAGKSTLARVLAGLVAPDAGSMSLRGRAYAPGGPREARALGIAIVHQELRAVPTLSVAEALFLGRLPARFGIVDRQRLRTQAAELLARVGSFGMDPDRSVASLGVGQLQLLEIATALGVRCDVLLLDEPTAALTPRETDALFAQVARLRQDGAAVVFISHRLEEVARVADRVSVLRDGRLVATRPASELPRDEMVRLMVGRSLASTTARAAPSLGEVALRAEALSGSGFRDVGFEVRKGELLGLFGLMGAGRTELLRAIVGADRATSGRVFVGAASEPARIGSPRDAKRLGLSFLSEDRKRDGLLMPFSPTANATLGSLGRAATRWGGLRPAREASLVRPLFERLGLAQRSPPEPVARLSGGNQQKVLLARALLSDPAVFLLDEPTRGVDVAARAEVHDLLLALASRGKALVVASSELEELFAIADRILVLSRGRVTAELRRGEWSAERVIAAAVAAPEGGRPSSRTA
jgi:ribose transport system ATP-binding protein